MTKPIEFIVRSYIQLRDRAALERMREHRNRLLQENRFRAAEGFRAEELEIALQTEVDTLDEALARLAASDS